MVSFFYELNEYDLFNLKNNDNFGVSKNVDKFINENNLDGVVILSGTILQLIFKDNIDEFLHNVRIPVVSVGKKIEGCNAVLIDNFNSVKKIVTKLIKLDKSRKFIMIKGPKTSKEAKERLDGFLSAIESANIKKENVILFDGDFNASSVENVFPKIKKIINKKTKVSVFACNDEMAIRLCKKSIEDGIKIPEQMFILGFDGLQRCVEYSLSTIQQPFDLIGKTILNNILNIINKKHVEDSMLPLNFINRKSTGNNANRLEYFSNQDFRYEYLSIERNFFNLLNSYVRSSNPNASALWKMFANGLLNIGIKECYLFLKKDIVFANSDEDLNVMVVGYNPLKNYINENGWIEFSDDLALHDNGIIVRRKSNFLVYPLFSKEHNYGTIVFAVNNEFDYCFYELIVARLISFLEVFMSMLQKNKELALKKKEADENLRDGLTGLYTRKWLASNFDRIFADVKRKKLAMCMFYFDVDNFKKINDIHGHHEGDVALNYVVKIIQNVFRKNDYIIRDGGDEFLVITCLPSVDSNYKKNIKTRLLKEQKNINNEIASKFINSDLEAYSISLSMGMSCCDNNSSLNKDVFKLLRDEADKKMYKNKKKK
ncbi:MAG: GGDEF domain-containing protein [Patescibacteria group bacterium]